MWNKLNEPLRKLVFIWAGFFVFNLISGGFIMGVVQDVSVDIFLEEQTGTIQEEFSRQMEEYVQTVKQEVSLRLRDFSPAHRRAYKEFSQYVDLPRDLLVVGDGEKDTYPAIFENQLIDPESTEIVSLTRIGKHHIQIILLHDEKEIEYTMFVKGLTGSDVYDAMRHGKDVYLPAGYLYF